MKRILDNLVPPSSGERFVALDGLRALAILGVLLGHTTDLGVMPESFSAVAESAVIVFFALSAFLLYYPILNKNALPNLREYYVRRILRIYPAYVIALGVTILVVPDAREASPGVIGAHLLFLQTFNGEWVKAIAEPLWFLPPLIHFYLIFPLLAWACLRRPRILGVLFILAFLAQIRGFYPRGFPLHQNWPLLALPFLCGMAAAQLAISRPKRLGFLGPVGIALVLFYAFYLRPISFTVSGSAFYALNARGPVICLFSFMAVLGLSCEHGITANLLSTRIMRLVAMASYGAFLFHYSIRSLLYRSYGEIVCTYLMIPVSLLVGILSYLCIEAPVMRFARKRVFQRPQEAPAAANPSPPGSFDGA